MEPQNNHQLNTEVEPLDLSEKGLDETRTLTRLDRRMYVQFLSRRLEDSR